MRTRIKKILAMVMCAALLSGTVADPVIYTAYASGNGSSKEYAKESGALIFALSDGTPIADGEFAFTIGTEAVTPQINASGGYVFAEEPGVEIGYKFTRKGVKDITGTVKLTEKEETVTLNIIAKKDTILTKVKDLTPNYLDGGITLEGLVSVTEGYDGTIGYSVLSGTAFTVAEKILTPVSVGDGILRVTAHETDEYKETYLDIPLTVSKASLGEFESDAFTWSPAGKLYDGGSGVTLSGQIIDTSILKAGDNVSVTAEAMLDNALGGDANAIINGYTIADGSDKYTLTIAEETSVPFTVSFAVIFALEDGSAIADGELNLTKDGSAYYPETNGSGQYTFKDTLGTEIGYSFLREGYKPLYGSFSLSEGNQAITLYPELKGNVELIQTKDISMRYMDAPISIDGLVTAQEGYDGTITYEALDGSVFSIDGTTLTVLAPGEGTIRAYASGTDNFNAAYLDIKVSVGKKELGALTADDFIWSATSKAYDGDPEVTIYGTLSDITVLAENDTFTVEAKATLDSAEAGRRTAAVTAYSVLDGADKYSCGGVSGTDVPYNVWFVADISLEDGSDIADGELVFTKDGETYVPEAGNTSGLYVFKEAPGTVIGYAFNRDGYKPLSGSITFDESRKNIVLSPELKNESTLEQAIDPSLNYMDAPISIEGLVTAPEGYDGTITYSVISGEAFTVDGTTLIIQEPGTGTIRATASETDTFTGSYMDIVLIVGKKDFADLTADDFTWEQTSKVYDGKTKVTLNGTLKDTSILTEGDTFTVEASATLDSADAGARSASITAYSVVDGANRYMASGLIGSSVAYNVWFIAAFMMEDGSDIADGELTLTKDGESYTPEAGDTDSSYIFKEPTGTVIGYEFRRNGYKPLSGNITLSESSQDITLSPELKDDPGLEEAIELTLRYKDAPVSIDGLVTAKEGYDGTITYSVADGDAFSIDGTTLTVITAGNGTIRASASETDYFKEGYIDIKVIVMQQDLALTADAFTWEPTEKAYDGETKASLKGTLKDTSILDEGDTFAVEATAELDSADAGARSAAITSFSVTEGADKYTSLNLIGTTIAYNVWYTAAFVMEDGSAIKDGELFLTKDGESYTPETAGSGSSYILKEAPDTSISYEFRRNGYKPLYGVFTLSESSQEIVLSPEPKEDPGIAKALDLSLHYMDGTVSIEGLAKALDRYDGTITYSVADGDTFSLDGVTLTVLKTGEGTIRALASETDYFKEAYIDIPLTVEKKDLGVLAAGLFTWENTKKVYDGSSNVTINGTLIYTSALAAGDSLTVSAKAVLDDPEPGARNAVIKDITIKDGADNYTFSFEEGASVAYTVSQAEAVFTVDGGTAPKEDEITFAAEDGTAVTPEAGSEDGKYFFNEQIGTKITYTFTQDGYKALEGTFTLRREPITVTLSPEKLEVNSLTQEKELELTYTDLSVSIDGLVSTSEGYDDVISYEAVDGDAFTVDGTTLYVVKTGTGTLRASTVRTPKYEANYIDIVITVDKTDIGTLHADAFTWDKSEKMYDASDKAVLTGTLTDSSALREGETLIIVANATIDKADTDASKAVIDRFAITTGGDNYTFEFEDDTSIPFAIIPYSVTFKLSDGTALGSEEVTLAKVNEGAPVYKDGDKDGEYLFTETEGTEISYRFFREDYKPVEGTVALTSDPASVDITLTAKDINELTQTRELSVTYTDLSVSLAGLIKSSFDDYDGEITYSVADGDAFIIEGEELLPVKVGSGTLHVNAAVTDDYKAASVDIKVTVEKTDLGVLSPDAFTWEDTKKAYDTLDTATVKGTLTDTSVLRQGEKLSVTADVRLNSPDAGEREATIENFTITEGDENYSFTFEEQTYVPYTVSKAEVIVKAGDRQAAQYSNTWEALCAGSLPKNWLKDIISVTAEDENVKAEAEALDLTIYIDLSIEAADYVPGEYTDIIVLALSEEEYKNIDFKPADDPNGTLQINQSSVRVAFSGTLPKNGYYFNSDRTMTISFAETEFDENRASIVLSMNGTAGIYGVRELSNLSGINFVSAVQRSDVYIYTYTFLAEKDAENEYTLDVTYDDGSSIKHADFGNTAAGTYFIMDAKAPEAPTLSFDAETSNGYYVKDMNLTVNYKDSKSTYGSLDKIALYYENKDTDEGVKYVADDTVNTGSSPVTEYTYTYAVPTAYNNGTITYTAVAYDLAGNISESKEEIKIDTVEPLVTVSYLQNSPLNGMYFNSTRTMELKITEKNFSEDLVTINITENGEEAGSTLKELLSNSGNGKNVYAVSSSNDEHVYRIDFGTSETTDVEYTVGIYASDIAGNKQYASYGDSAAPTHFVIDKIAPVFTLSFTDMAGYPFTPSTVAMSAFTQSGVITTLNVVEKHFAAGGMSGVLGLGITSTDINGADNAAYSDYNIQVAKNLTAWTSNGDSHSYRMEGFSSDANYSISASFTDLAGNMAGYAMHYFTVDKSAPSGSVSFTSQDGTETSTSLNASHMFYHFSRSSVPMSVDASDQISGIANVAYYIYDPGNEARGTFSGLSYETLLTVPWTTWNGSATLNADEAGVIYARITDHAGNVTYLSTVSGVVVDSTAPSQPNISITTAASAYGAYNSDVSVTIYAEDPENGGTYSGLRSLSYTVTSAGKVTQSGNFNDDLSDRTARTRSISRNITVVAADNNTNEVEISVIATDWSGNTSTSKRTIKIDTVSPVIDVSYDLNEPLNEKYFNQSRTATIRVTDRNFISSAVTIIVNDLDGNAKPLYGAWTLTATEGTSDSEYSERTVTFFADGDYTLSVSVQDAAGNTAQYTSPGDFVIDKTAPVISVSYDNNDATNDKYYNASRTAEVKIDEKNFSADAVHVTLTADLEDERAKAPALGEWSADGIMNTSYMDFDKDGNYRLTINYTDLAGNSAVAYTGEEFIIDCTAPDLTIKGVKDKSANRGDVEVKIAAADTNIGEATATAVLTGTRHDSVTLANAMTFVDNEWVMTLPEFKHEPDVDDIYTLTAAVTDLAGNVTSKSITFSINRFGSNYSFDKDTEKLLKKYFLTNCGDCVVYETNVDILNVHKVSISHDGTVTILKEEKGYKVEAEETEEGWNQYKYTIFADNFDEEGLYELLISSTDEAGNSQDNKLKDYGMTFIVDKSAPSVVFADLENNGRYREASHPFSVVLQDNVSMESAILYVDGQMMLAFNKDEIDTLKGKLSYELASADTWQNVKVVAADSAGNETTVEGINILVSSDFWIQFKANKPLFAGSIAGISAAAAAAVWAVLYRRRRRAA